jgi:hypothetical protein
MNAHTKSLALVAGLLLLSSWSLQAARFALPGSHLPLTPRVAALPKAPAAAPALEARQKVALQERLSAVVRDPKQIQKADVRQVRSSFGADAAQMLDLLRQSAD